MDDRAKQEPLNKAALTRKKKKSLFTSKNKDLSTVMQKQVEKL